MAHTPRDLQMGSPKKRGAPASPPNPGDYASAWFAMLERAIRTRDGRLEKLARAELARLGVAVWIDETKLLAPAGGLRP